MAGVKVHGHDQDGGKIYVAGDFPGKLQLAFSRNLISKRNPIPYSSHISDTPFDAHAENSEKTSEAPSAIPTRKKRELGASLQHDDSGTGILISVSVVSIRTFKQTR